jgi:hypothetical protein
MTKQDWRSTREPERDVAPERHPTATELREGAGPAPNTPAQLFALWCSLLGPPAAWAIQLVLSDGFSELGCRAGGFSSQPLVLLAITIATAAISVFAGLLALRGLRRVRRTDGERETPRQRAEFMAEGGIVSSVLFTLLILMGGVVPHLVLQVCGA